MKTKLLIFIVLYLLTYWAFGDTLDKSVYQNPTLVITPLQDEKISEGICKPEDDFVKHNDHTAAYETGMGRITVLPSVDISLGTLIWGISVQY